jgi:hypothetical protein
LELLAATLASAIVVIAAMENVQVAGQRQNPQINQPQSLLRNRWDRLVEIVRSAVLEIVMLESAVLDPLGRWVIIVAATTVLNTVREGIIPVGLVMAAELQLRGQASLLKILQ